VMTEKTKKRCREKVLGRAMRVLEGLWKALEISGTPPLEAAERLVCGEDKVAMVSFSYGRKEALINVGFPSYVLGFPTPLPTFPPVHLRSDPKGNVEVEVEGIFAREGRAFFTTTTTSKMEKVVEVARSFHPLFEALGLGDLGDALETLAGLGEGEARMEGEYLLMRNEDPLLKRGSLLGNFELDKAFLAKQEVALSFPGDMELAIQGRPSWEGLVYLRGLEIRWGEEKVRFGTGSKQVKARANGDDPIGELVRKRVARELRNPGFRPSPRMRALLETLVEQKKPLLALKKDTFLRKALLRTLSLV
jgi:hypothetical protein